MEKLKSKKREREREMAPCLKGKIWGKDCDVAREIRKGKDGDRKRCVNLDSEL